MTVIKVPVVNDEVDAYPPVDLSGAEKAGFATDMGLATSAQLAPVSAAAAAAVVSADAATAAAAAANANANTRCLDTAAVKHTGNHSMTGVLTLNTFATYSSIPQFPSGNQIPRHSDIAVVANQLIAAIPVKHMSIDIGDWNMDTTAYVTITHDIPKDNIRGVSAIIRPDSNSQVTYNYDLNTSSSLGVNHGYISGLTGTTLTLVRVTSGLFDNADYDQIYYNRGWVTITYI